MFIILGLSAGLPFFSFPWFPKDTMMKYHLFPWALGGAIYIGGAVLYATRVPERCKPGAFDIVGHSHQIFHVCVIVACFIHFRESISLYYRSQEFFCPAL